MTNLKSVLEGFLKQNPKVKQKMIEKKIKNNWERLFGRYFNEKIQEFKIYDNKLEITLNSSSLREDLFMKKEILIKELNLDIGTESRINDIIFY